MQIPRGKLGSATCGQGQSYEKNSQGTTLGALQAVGSECSDGRQRIVNIEERNVRSKVKETTVQGTVLGAVIVRPTGRKDRHSKVRTESGLRDRRVRLSAPTAIQFFDVQDRLGFDQPSKAVDWLIEKAKPAIDELRTLPVAGSERLKEPNISSAAASVLPEASVSARPPSFPSSTSLGTVLGRDVDGGGKGGVASARLLCEIKGGGVELEGGSGDDLNGGLSWPETGLGMAERGAAAGDGSAGGCGTGEASGKGGWRTTARDRARERAKEERARAEEDIDKSSRADHLSTLSSISRTAQMTHLLPLRPPPPSPSSRSPLSHRAFLPDVLLRPLPQPLPHSHSSSLLHPQLTMLPASSLLAVISQSSVSGEQHAGNVHHSSLLSFHQPALFSSPVVSSEPSAQLSVKQQQNFSRQVSSNERTVASSRSSSTSIILAGPRPPSRPPLFSTPGPLQSTFCCASSPSPHSSSDQNLVLDYESGFHVMSPGRDIASSLENSVSRISHRIQSFADHEVEVHEESKPPSLSS